MPNHSEITTLDTDEWAFCHSVPHPSVLRRPFLGLVISMKSFRSFLALVSPLILVCGMAVAQAAAAQSTSRVTPQIMPVSALHRRMRVVADTVCDATTPE